MAANMSESKTQKVVLSVLSTRAVQAEAEPHIQRRLGQTRQNILNVTDDVLWAM